MRSEAIFPVLLTGIGGGGHGEQILKALRQGSLKYKIVGTDTTGDCANRHEADEFFTVPHASDPSYLDAITKIAREQKCIAIFHGSEAEMRVLSRAKRELNALGFYVPVNSPSVMDVCLDKVRTLEFLCERGVRVPAFRRIESVEDAQEFPLFPAILKPAVGGGGSAHTYIIQDSEELVQMAQYLLRVWPHLTVQEYVGTPDREFTVGVLFGQDGKLINSIAVRRIINNALTIKTKVPNRTSRADLGPFLIVSSGISQGQVGRWESVTSQCERIATYLNPTAPINIQCRMLGGIAVPFEINPRFSGTTSLRALAGYNEPDVLLRRDVLRETVEIGFPYKEITVLRTLNEFVISLETKDKGN